MFTTQQLQAIRALVVARRDVAAPEAPDRPLWDGLLGTVDGELRVARSRRAGKAGTTEVGASGGGAGLTEADVGERVFAIDLPLQIEVLPTPRVPKPRKRPPTEKELARMLLREKARAKKGPPKPIVLPTGATLNAYNACPPWKKIKTREYLDRVIAAELANWPAAHWGGTIEVGTGKDKRRTPVGGKRRFVRLTRFSSRRPDEVTIDCAGGKFGLDRLVQAGVLGGDSHAWIERDARWVPASVGEGKLRIEVFELHGEHGVPRPAAARKRPKKKASDAADPVPDDPT